MPPADLLIARRPISRILEDRNRPLLVDKYGVRTQTNLRCVEEGTKFYRRLLPSKSQTACRLAGCQKIARTLERSLECGADRHLCSDDSRCASVSRNKGSHDSLRLPGRGWCDVGIDYANT